MDLIGIIIIIVIISKVIKKAGEASESVVGKTGNAWDASVYRAPKNATRVDSAKIQIQREQARQAAMQNIQQVKQRAQQKFMQMQGGSTRTDNEHFQQADMHRQQENRQAMQQVHASRMEARNTTILQRAKANAEEDKVDVTLETMEAEHNHSERVSAAIHHHPDDIISDSMLGTVEDLMVKGFDGNLCFERDFVGEGLDMISRFSYQ